MDRAAPKPVPVPAEAVRESESTATGSMPPPLVGKLVSYAVAIHFAAIALSYLAIVAPSSTQSRMVDLFLPYLSVGHFDAEGIPLNLSTSNATEKLHVLTESTKLMPESENDWVPSEELGTQGGDRQRRWQRLLANVAKLGESEQGALAAWLVEPLARIAADDAKQLRITRQPDLMTTVVDDTAAPPYTVAIVGEQSGDIRLIQVPPPRLAAPPVGALP